MALIVWQRPNLLLLDEPTNHLDLDMRQALTFALQAYEGAMVIVSHDRYLLRATTDDLYLVHDRQVIPFDGDLNDYHKWLGEQQKQERRDEQSNKPDVVKEHSAVNRKEQKRLEAEMRKQTAPLRKKITQWEKEMDRHQADIAIAEEALSDSDLYLAENKAEMTRQLAKQATAKSGLEEAEMMWMELQEELEILENSLNEA